MDNEEEVTLGQALNTDSGASSEETQELLNELHPEAKQPPATTDEPNDELDEDLPDERSGRVDEELDAAANDTEREAIRARRRVERQNKRQRAKDRVATLERRLADEKAQRQNVEQRLLNLERNNLGSQIAQLSQAEQEANQAEAGLERTIAEATAKQDGNAVAAATRQLVQLQAFKGQIATAKQNLETEAKKPPQRHLDSAMVEQADNFRKENPWYKGPNSDDEHSGIVSAIDRQLFKEGWDPATPAYWQELRSRSAKYLPERFKKGAQGGAQGEGGTYNAANVQGSGSKRSPVAGGSGGSGSSQPGGRTKTFQLSEARVQAMKDSGDWDDVERRKRVIARYKKYDEEHPTN